MARCTAPREGHRTASGRANCPACGGGYSRGYGGWGGGYSSSYSPSPYSSYSGSSGSSGSARSGGGSGGSARPRWSPVGSSVGYTPAEVRALTPFREALERLGPKPDKRDIFLCHAWDDRAGDAKQLHDLLESKGVKVWFSEKDVMLGAPLMREIDRGLANSRVGIVLVTPHLLKRLKSEGIADKELSALLARDQLIPIVHGVTYDELRDVSPMLASRSGMDTKESPMPAVAAKLKELLPLFPEVPIN
ncbi:toll/interleukin-1 receptor domain-containing protein [Edaphobacter albus]|uniref:toll/interleukin-1 receptor domain-containing protein n=1 Tax=Edaphobacter sp. 4G125 TaxID=2763071 RepID=UPI001646EC78|nr:toll/interleukin-1 receptor domain-containing protein [Edaphobacter sp. 4G125]QNI35847.1 toll/interleukin-1 receptor domain-containing protein [Edaphobacter sp. 4G125]